MKQAARIIACNRRLPRVSTPLENPGAGFAYDSGIGGDGIPFCEFTAPLVLDSGAVGQNFKVPPAPVD